MKSFGWFTEESLESFSTEYAQRCQREDGTFYGTSGKCRKGKEAGPKEEAEKKPKAKSSMESDAAAAIEELRAGMTGMNEEDFEWDKAREELGDEDNAMELMQAWRGLGEAQYGVLEQLEELQGLKKEVEDQGLETKEERKEYTEERLQEMGAKIIESMDMGITMADHWGIPEDLEEEMYDDEEAFYNKRPLVKGAMDEMSSSIDNTRAAYNKFMEKNPKLADHGWPTEWYN